MVQITSLTNLAIQELNLRLDDGSTLTLTLYYRPTAQRWIFDCSYSNWAVKGQNLCVHPNILRNWRKIIPFGLTITSSDGADPFDQDDFVNGRISIYVLDSTNGGTDVDQVEQQVFGEIPL